MDHIQIGLVKKLLKQSLMGVYGPKFISFKIQDVMKYPMRDNKLIVIYDLFLKGEIPIERAKIVINVESCEIEKFDPAML
jgi:hypothetical protein